MPIDYCGTLCCGTTASQARAGRGLVRWCIECRRQALESSWLRSDRPCGWHRSSSSLETDSTGSSCVPYHCQGNPIRPPPVCKCVCSFVTELQSQPLSDFGPRACICRHRIQRHLRVVRLQISHTSSCWAVPINCQLWVNPHAWRCR